MNERMDERYGLDTPQEREREDMALRKKYQALEKENADLKQQVATHIHDLGHLQDVNNKLMDRVARLSAVAMCAKEFSDGIQTCHICGASLVIDNSAPHCLDCSDDCDDHDEPDCKSAGVLLAALDAALIASRTTPAKEKA